MYIQSRDWCSSSFINESVFRSCLGDGLELVITGITCIFCCDVFPTPEEFNEHLQQTHPEENPLLILERKKVDATDNSPIDSIDKTGAPVPPCEKIKDTETKASDPVKPKRWKLPRKSRGSKMYLVKENGKFECSSCGKECSTKSTMYSHYEKIHRKGYPCEVCKKLLPSRFALKKHHLIHKEKMECPVCSKKITQLWYPHHVSRHKDIANGSFKCNLCNKLLGSAWALSSHKQSVHLKSPRYACKKCGKNYYKKDKLLAHDVDVHQFTPRECTICNKTFQSETTLRRHNPCHNPRLRKMKCPVCLKVMSMRSMKIHEKTHAGTREEGVCDVCGKTFFNLTAHMRTHTGEKPYSCDKCDKSFSRPCTLVSHKRTHTNERPFVCNVCDKGFTQRTPLKVHMRCHTGERPYACQICSKTFITRGLLNGHRCPGPS